MLPAFTGLTAGATNLAPAYAGSVRGSTYRLAFSPNTTKVFVDNTKTVV